jgi:hypothetical protein
MEGNEAVQNTSKSEDLAVSSLYIIVSLKQQAEVG